MKEVTIKLKADIGDKVWVDYPDYGICRDEGIVHAIRLSREGHAEDYTVEYILGINDLLTIPLREENIYLSKEALRKAQANNKLLKAKQYYEECVKALQEATEALELADKENKDGKAAVS